MKTNWRQSLGADLAALGGGDFAQERDQDEARSDALRLSVEILVAKAEAGWQSRSTILYNVIADHACILAKQVLCYETDLLEEILVF